MINKWTYTKTDGIYHVVRTPSYGYQAAEGDTVEFWYKGYTLDGKVFDTNDKSIAKEAKLDTTIRSFKMLKLIAGKSNIIDGLNSGLIGINEGEYATIVFPSSLGFGSVVFGSVKVWSPLAYDIKLINVNNTSIQQEKSYISTLNLSGYKDTLGLFINHISIGTGSLPTLSDTIYGWYRGTIVNDNVFDEVVTDNKQIILASKDMPEGLRLGFSLTKVSGITDLVLPSYHGFGNKGSDLVKPYETIRYRIRLDSIK